MFFFAYDKLHFNIFIWFWENQILLQNWIRISTASFSSITQLCQLKDAWEAIKKAKSFVFLANLVIEQFEHILPFWLLRGHLSTDKDVWNWKKKLCLYWFIFQTGQLAKKHGRKIKWIIYYLLCDFHFVCFIFDIS